MVATTIVENLSKPVHFIQCFFFTTSMDDQLNDCKSIRVASLLAKTGRMSFRSQQGLAKFVPTFAKAKKKMKKHMVGPGNA